MLRYLQRALFQRTEICISSVHKGNSRRPSIHLREHKAETMLDSTGIQVPKYRACCGEGLRPRVPRSLMETVGVACAGDQSPPSSSADESGLNAQHLQISTRTVIGTA